MNLKSRKNVEVIRVGGIRALVSCNGIIRTNRSISKKMQDEFSSIVDRGKENILDGWVVDGEYKNGCFYVNNIFDENCNLLCIEDTIGWAKIMEFVPPSIFKNNYDSRYEKRPEGTVPIDDYYSETKEFSKKGNKSRTNWKKMVIEELKNGI